MKKTVFWGLIVSVVFFLNVQVRGQEQSPDVPEEASVSSGMTPGLIFNTANLLLDLAAYQSGFGLMLRNEEYALRTLINVEYESGQDLLEAAVGAAYVRPFFTGRVFPYWGASLKGGYSYDRDEVDSQNWLETRTLTAELAVLFGAELYLLELLSVFAEYQLGAAFSRAKVIQDSDGNQTETSSMNYRIGTGLGNEASIGVVLYLEHRPLPSEDTEQ